ncbi:unnamed protein product [Symbiodinium natans]|uniref:Uncharacterized protein n=1 Tax=Symbiodinium natans TaxID=878477 RepID=A0A812MUW6_9DINO|nr:unnamed protein product [Symbiodinium natans]
MSLSGFPRSEPGVGTCQLLSKLLSTFFRARSFTCEVRPPLRDVTNVDAYEKTGLVTNAPTPLGFEEGPLPDSTDPKTEWTSTTTTTGQVHLVGVGFQVFNFTLVGQGICASGLAVMVVSMERITHQPDVGSRDSCQDAEISGCAGFCGLYTGAVKHADNQNTSSCWASFLQEAGNAPRQLERAFYSAHGRLLSELTTSTLDGLASASRGYTPYPNRASNVPVVITQGGQSTTLRVNQKQGRQKLLGRYTFTKGDTIKLATYGVDGKVVADALKLSSCNDDLTSELQAPSEARSWLSELGFQRVSIQGADLIALNPKPETPKPPISPHLPPKPSKPPKPPQNPQKPSKNLPKPPETQTPQNSTPKLGRCPRRSGSWSSGRRLGLQTVAAQFRGL